MGPKVYDARIRPSGVNATGNVTTFYENILLNIFKDFIKIFYLKNDVQMLQHL